MPASKFRFVSPGVKIAEIDNSQLPALPDEVGPVIIGRAVRGPGLRPVQVNSMSEFVEIFGMPTAGNSKGDIWRKGPSGVAPTYGAYAAQAWLRNSSPVTFVRLLGRANDQAGATKANGAAGWKVGSAPNLSGLGGGYGLFIMPSSSGDWSTTPVTGCLAAVFYCSEGLVELSGAALVGTDGTAQQGAGSSVWIKSDANYALKAQIVQSGTFMAEGNYRNNDLVTDTVVFDFQRSSKNFIRKAFQTNPTKTNSSLFDSAALQTYFLGESYEGMFDKYIGGNQTYYASICALDDGTIVQNSQLRSLTKSRSPWTIAQNLGSTGSYNPENMQKLFRFITHEGGEWESQNLKISINNIQGPTNEFDDYGSFTVEIRLASDTDSAVQVVEAFTLCNLNPQSPNYVARRIGDTYVEWQDDERRYREYGAYQNQSKYVRVEMNADVNDEATGQPSYVPFGFLGPVRWKGFSCFSGSSFTMKQGVDDANDANKDTDVFVEGFKNTLQWFSGSATHPRLDSDEGYGNEGDFIYTNGTDMSASIYFPSIPIRISSSEGNLSSPKDAYFGITTVRPNATSRFDESYVDLVRAFPDGVGDADGNASSTNQEYAQMFSLDDIVISGNIAFYRSGSMKGTGTSTAADGGHTNFEITGGTGNVTNTVDNWGGIEENLDLVVTDGAGTTITYRTDYNDSVVETSTLFRVDLSVGGTFTAPSASAEHYILALTAAFSRSYTGDTIAGWSFNDPTTNHGNGTQSGTIWAVSESFPARAPAPATPHATYHPPVITLHQQTSGTSGNTAFAGSVATTFNGARSGSLPYGAANLFISGAIGPFSGGAGVTDTGIGTSANAISSSYNEILKQGFDKFTLPLIGGFDGLNIQEKDPFNNTRDLAASKTELNNYAVNSAKMAIDSVADPEKIEYNLMAMPGVTSTNIQNHMIKTCEDRADALCVLDLAGDYTPPQEVSNDQSEVSRRGDVQTTVDNLITRALNTSYACSYYPWVQLIDSESGNNIWAPPSIPAIGTFSSAQKKSELWFAPAGFTRGGLTDGSAGLAVSAVKQKLTSKERDKLYAANINPIASFPAEGIVIFGQKTLQVTPSALDRINVRRLLIYVKREISIIASRLLFEQNVQSTWDRFNGQVTPFLNSIVARLGLTDYKVILDETTTTADMIDRNMMYAKIYLKPARAIEFIAIDFVITNTGASFED